MTARQTTKMKAETVVRTRPGWRLTSRLLIRHDPREMSWPLRCILVLGFLLLALVAACGDEAVTRFQPTFTPGNGTETISIVVAEDEIVLSGHLFGGQNEVGVILSHMQPNDQSAWFAFAQSLADHGYAALTFDFRGYGDSQGEKDFSTLDEDLREALRFMRDDRGLTQVFLIGASMGGTTSLVVAAQEDVAGVIAVSAPARFEDQDALSVVAGIVEPKLFIASEDDTAAMLSLQELEEAAGEPTESESYPGNAHGTNLLLSDFASEFRMLIEAFLEEQGGA